ncbi:MAG: single-stranded DNA-binding protein [Anaerolineae bacterium]|nr:single-stranded DNA-binding protein [Anaerolineae bacterium]MBN8618831.1 single-stranded DNA-binding protein [Anaerolineae bacterium]
MAGWSQTIIIGNVGRDVNLRYTQSGVPVADFSVAVTRRFGGRDGGERQEKTTWYRVTCWRNLAEIASQFVRKGTQVMVVGTVEASAYLDKSGQPAATIELTADNFQMLGSRQDGERGGDDYAPPPPDSMGDIPF